jgi:hypothetical protein
VIATVDSLRLIDWDAWRLDLGAEDLAYMMALHWYPERRRRVEMPLLRRYHEALTSHGVSGYGFEFTLGRTTGSPSSGGSPCPSGKAR